MMLNFETLKISLFECLVGFLLILQRVNPAPIHSTAADPISASNQPEPNTWVSFDFDQYQRMYFPQTPRELQRIKQKHVHHLLSDPTYKTVKDIQDGIFGWSSLPIPVKNTRQILIHSVLPLEPKARSQRITEFVVYIMNKEPVFENKTEIQVRELKLLSLGVLVECQWAHQLPPPFNDKQCTLEELDILLRRICIDELFIGLSMCLDDEQNISR